MHHAHRLKWHFSRSKVSNNPIGFYSFPEKDRKFWKFANPGFDAKNTGNFGKMQTRGLRLKTWDKIHFWRSEGKPWQVTKTGVVKKLNNFQMLQTRFVSLLMVRGSQFMSNHVKWATGREVWKRYKCGIDVGDFDKVELRGWSFINVTDRTRCTVHNSCQIMSSEQLVAKSENVTKAVAKHVTKIHEANDQKSLPVIVVLMYVLSG